MELTLAVLVAFSLAGCGAGGLDGLGSDQANESDPLVGWLQSRGILHRLSSDAISTRRGIFETFDRMNAQALDASVHFDIASADEMAD